LHEVRPWPPTRQLVPFPHHPAHDLLRCSTHGHPPPLPEFNPAPQAQYYSAPMYPCPSKTRASTTPNPPYSRPLARPPLFNPPQRPSVPLSISRCNNGIADPTLPNLHPHPLAPSPQAQYYSAPERQYRFFKRLAQAFVRVGLIDDGATTGAQTYNYLPGATLSVKEAVSRGFGGGIGGW